MEPVNLRPVVSVRVFVKDSQGRILLLQRAGSAHASGQWCLPGGKLDYMEAPETAAIRELEEETGLRVGELRFLFYQNSLPLVAGEMHCVNLYFEGEAVGEVTINAESKAHVWVSLEEAVGYRPVFSAEQAIERYREVGAAQR